MLMTGAFVLICASLMLFLSKHWVFISKRDLAEAQKTRLTGHLAWSEGTPIPAKPASEKPQPLRRKRPDNAFQDFLRGDTSA